MSRFATRVALTVLAPSALLALAFLLAGTAPTTSAPAFTTAASTTTATPTTAASTTTATPTTTTIAAPTTTAPKPARAKPADDRTVSCWWMKPTEGETVCYSVPVGYYVVREIDYNKGVARYVLVKAVAGHVHWDGSGYVPDEPTRPAGETATNRSDLPRLDP